MMPLSWIGVASEGARSSELLIGSGERKILLDTSCVSVSVASKKMCLIAGGEVKRSKIQKIKKP